MNEKDLVDKYVSILCRYDLKESTKEEACFSIEKILDQMKDEKKKIDFQLALLETLLRKLKTDEIFEEENEN